MPELPEVETVRRGLVPVWEGRKIAQLTLRRPDLRWPFPPKMQERVSGARIQQLGRRSKYLLARLDRGETLLIHLGMSGRILISSQTVGQFAHPHEPLQKHDHVVFDMEDGTRVTFNDPRRFGAMDLMETANEDSHPLLAKLGPEPLSNGFNEAYLRAALAGRKSPIKTVLLDQRIIAGLGNIYVCEALWRAKIHPARAAGRVGATRIEALTQAIRDVIAEAIHAGGSSLRDYRQTDGNLGYFQHQFAVYDREGAACQRSECPGMIRRIVQSGRSSFYCSQCQR